MVEFCARLSYEKMKVLAWIVVCVVEVIVKWGRAGGGEGEGKCNRGLCRKLLLLRRVLRYGGDGGLSGGRLKSKVMLEDQLVVGWGGTQNGKTVPRGCSINGNRSNIQYQPRSSNVRLITVGLKIRGALREVGG